MIDTKRLEELIELSGLKKSAIADRMGLTPYGLALKINNKNEFKVSEVRNLCDILGIDNKSRDSIFFHRK